MFAVYKTDINALNVAHGVKEVLQPKFSRRSYPVGLTLVGEAPLPGAYKQHVVHRLLAACRNEQKPNPRPGASGASAPADWGNECSASSAYFPTRIIPSAGTDVAVSVQKCFFLYIKLVIFLVLLGQQILIV